MVISWRDLARWLLEPRRVSQPLNRQFNTLRKSNQLSPWCGKIPWLRLVRCTSKTLDQEDWSSTIVVMVAPVSRRDWGSLAILWPAMVKICRSTATVPRKLWSNWSLMMEFRTGVTEKMFSMLSSAWWAAILIATRTFRIWHASTTPECSTHLTSKIQLRSKWMNF